MKGRVVLGVVVDGIARDAVFTFLEREFHNRWCLVAADEATGTIYAGRER